ncbi:hypothetical protein [Spongiimicrobium salis]|uniref:hypothetical protein n=1 Tax=Spongiimicrobium salis TaxID=1667022 RepID=UPI00374D19C5
MKYFLILFIIIQSCSQRNKEPNKKMNTDIIAYEEKVEFFKNFKNSFNYENINTYKNISISNYYIRFVDTYRDKLKKIEHLLIPEDYHNFSKQLNQYEKLQNNNIEADFELSSTYNYITNSDFRKLGKTYDELWKNFKLKYGEKSLILVGKPLIGKNNNILILTIQIINETSNSVSELYAFEKRDGEWNLLTKL